MSAVAKLPQNESTALVAAVKTPVVLTSNFDEVRAHFIQQLERYDLVVTTETLADAKKLATELNKAATEVKSRGKTVSAEASAPIDAFNANVKELAQLLLDARSKLTEQIKQFEGETKAKALSALQDYLAEQYEAKSVETEFQTVAVEDLANLSTLTGTGKLAAKAKSAVDERVSTALHQQSMIEMRLVKLENESFKAGLSAPLSRAHVETFLFTDEQTYQQRLSSLLESELKREQAAQEAMRRKFEQEQTRNAEAEERARRAESERLQAEQARAEQQAKYEADMAKERKRHEEQLAEQQAHLQRAPQPISTRNNQGVQAIKHAIGALDNPRAAVMHTCTFSEACRLAAEVADVQKVAIWTKASGPRPEAILVRGDAVISLLNF